MSKVKTDEQEEIVDAKETGVATVSEMEISTEVSIRGVQLEFPFVRIGQGMSQWKTSETKSGKPEEGAFYIGKSKDTNFKIADAGKADGLYGIILELVYGYKEDRAYTPGNNVAPKRWIIAGLKEDGSPVTEKDALAAAEKEGFTLVPRETGEVWPDTGRPKMKANLAKFCYLCMLVPVPDTFESDEFRLYPIGDHLYTTVRFEFDKHYFKQFDSIMANIKSRAEFTNRDKKDYVFSVNGLVGHVYSFSAESKSGVSYTSHAFEKALRDGKPWEFTAREKEDFAKFLLSVKAGTASVSDVESEF